ncbi:oligoribonuclease [Nesidiocoris tenuis]|uniref:Oligoribonuclease n=1 Tax=Nesidiocoris tenuis TaxID=355587 RepID=A0ABN7ARE7_9HEMI|nr:oligoribonuclease [Nesidiocoris tenuis]
MRFLRHILKLSRFLPHQQGCACQKNVLLAKSFYGGSTLLNRGSAQAHNHVSEATMASTDETNVIWIDLEMTGLDPKVDHILEAACIVTDRHNNIIAEGPDIIIHQPLSILNTMNDWCKKHHTESGLFKSSLESEISLEAAESQLLEFVEKYTPRGKCPLAGNSVYMDKLFLLEYMPRLAEHLHYRILDVSSIKLLAKNWYNLPPPPKTYRHRALEDIQESIMELKYFQERMFKSPQEVKLTTGKEESSAQ